MKTVQYDQFRAAQLEDPETKREYEALAEEFTIAREVIELRHRYDLTRWELAERAGPRQPAKPHETTKP